jgi:hypothetical protein
MGVPTDILQYCAKLVSSNAPAETSSSHRRPEPFFGPVLSRLSTISMIVFSALL